MPRQPCKSCTVHVGTSPTSRSRIQRPITTQPPSSVSPMLPPGEYKGCVAWSCDSDSAFCQMTFVSVTARTTMCACCTQAEVRCHAVLCKTEAIAQTIDAQLQDRLAVALDEFMREKRRSQNSRLSVKLHHQTSLPNDLLSSPAGGSARTKFLKQGQNFRPPIGLFSFLRATSGTAKRVLAIVILSVCLSVTTPTS